MAWAQTILNQAANGIQSTMTAVICIGDVAAGGTALAGTQQVTWAQASGAAPRNNSNELDFPVATQVENNVDHVAFFTDATLTTLLGSFPLTAAQTIQVNQFGKFPVGSLTIPLS